MSKYVFIFSAVLFAWLLVFLAINCNKQSSEPDNIFYPDSNLSFIQHIHPIFLNNCTSNGCHESISPANGLDLETLIPTFNSINGPVVIPFDAQNSRLYRVLLADDFGIPRMPKNRGMLPEAQIRAIKTWIEEGAIINK